MKKIAAAVLIGAMLFSCSVTAFAEAYGDNLLTNPGFEDGSISGWIQETREQYTPNAVVEQDADGNYYVRLDATRLQAHNRLYQNNKTFYKGQVYKLGMKVWGIRTDESDEQISYTTAVRVRTNNGSGDNYYNAVTYENADANEFIDYLMLDADSACTVGIFASMEPVNCRYLCVDDVYVQPVTGIETYTFEDGSLQLADTGYTVWESVGGAEASLVSGGYESANALDVLPGGDGTYRHYVSFNAGTGYYISAMARAEGGNTLKLIFETTDGVKTELANTAATGEWQEVCAFINPSELAERGYVYWEASDSSGSKAQYQLDDVRAVSRSEFTDTLQVTFEGTAFQVTVDSPCTLPVYEIAMYDADGNQLYTGVYNQETDCYEFQVSDDLGTGTYTIRATIAGFSETETQIFYYNTNLLEALQLIDAADESEIGALLVQYAGVLGIEAAPYTELNDPAIIAQINKKLEQIDLSVDMDNLAESIQSKVELLNEVYNQAIVPSYFADCDDAVKLAAFAEKYQTGSLLEGDPYFAKITDTSPFYRYLLQVREYTEEVSLDNSEWLQSLYNQTIVAYAINESDYRKIPEILEYYNEQGVIDVSLNAYNSLDSAAKQNVLQSLKAEKIMDVTQFSARLAALCEDAASDDDKRGPTGGGGGGRGNGGYSGITITQPPAGQEQVSADTPEQTEQELNGQEAAQTAFDDIASVPWAAEAIGQLSQMGAVNGRSEGKFEPNESVTREEAVKMIVLTFGIPTEGATAAFIDVTLDSWYYPYVAAAKENGITNGVGGSRFGTGEQILRQDLAVMLHQIYIDQTQEPLTEAVQVFADYDEISPYAQQAVSRLSTLGIVNGREGNRFVPQDPVTRAEAAKMIYQTFQLICES